MADRIEINFTANTREVTKGTDNIATDLRKTERALQDVGDEGKASLDKITDAQGDVEQASGKVGDAFGEVGSIAKSALEGDLGGAADSALQSLSGLAALIPGVGSAVGVGLGTVLSEGIKTFSADVDAQAKASEERIQSMYDSFVESGVGYLTATQALSALDAITGDKDRLAELQKQADVLGLSIETVLTAQIQRGDQRNEVQQRANELLDEYNAKFAESSAPSAAAGVAAQNVENIVNEYERLNSEQNTATQQAEIYRRTAEQITGQLQASNEEIQIANRLLAETPKSIPVKLEVDSSAVDRALRQQRSLNVEVQLTRNGTAVR